jgi:hypothetical protein
MKFAHPSGHSVAGGIGVEAAIDGPALGDQPRKPRRVRSGARGGKAAVTGMKGLATEAINRGFA